jgi:hypothetical protein
MTTMPPTRVVNLRKAKYNVFIGRPSKWGNPFVIGQDGSRAEVMAKYKNHILTTPSLLCSLVELEGKVLGCYCKPLPCHGDILIEIINSFNPKFTIDSVLESFGIEGK